MQGVQLSARFVGTIEVPDARGMPMIITAIGRVRVRKNKKKKKEERKGRRKQVLNGKE